jgi:hypothetical protein
MFGCVFGWMTPVRFEREADASRWTRNKRRQIFVNVSPPSSYSNQWLLDIPLIKIVSFALDHDADIASASPFQSGGYQSCRYGLENVLR